MRPPYTHKHDPGEKILDRLMKTEKTRFFVWFLSIQSDALRKSQADFELLGVYGWMVTNVFFDRAIAGLLYTLNLRDALLV